MPREVLSANGSITVNKHMVSGVSGLEENSCNECQRSFLMPSEWPVVNSILHCAISTAPPSFLVTDYHFSA